MKHEETGFEHLHLHTHFSLLDGYGFCHEYTERAKRIGQRFLCVSDHGMMAAVPNQLKACEKDGIQPIFACELYVHPEQPELKIGDKMGSTFLKDATAEERKEWRKSHHLLAIAHSEEGYRNLVHLTSWGWLHGFYHRPRVSHEQLEKHKAGITFSSACYNGEVGQAFGSGGEDAAYERIKVYKDMFGEHFYLEMMLLDFAEQKPYNAFLVKAHEKTGIPLIITQDAHYAEADDCLMQRKMLMVQTGKTMKQIEEAMRLNEHADFFELQDENLWMKSEDELNAKWEEDGSIDYELFKEAKRNSVRICEKAEGVQIDRSIKLPKLAEEDGALAEEVVKGMNWRHMPRSQVYMDRIREELGLIKEKEFSSYFLIQQMMTDEARRYWAEIFGGDGSEAVGPGRGSGCGSLVNYLLGITDVDPIPHGLLFSRFLSPARGGKTMNYQFAKKPTHQTVVEEVELEPEDDCPFDAEPAESGMSR